MKALKKVAAMAVAGVCVVSMAACGGTGSSSEATSLTYPGIELGKTGKDLTASIKLFSNRTDMTQASYSGKSWKEYIADFNKLYPDIKVSIETSTNYDSDALTRIQSKDWGDIMLIPAVDSTELGNYFIPYGSYKEMNKVINFAAVQQYDNQVYGVSGGGDAGGVVYNKAIFKEAGITELPITPSEFIADLKLIKKNTSATPLYTNYAAGWTMGAWDAYIGGNATGNADYMTSILPHTKDPFSNPKDGTHPYNVYKILYDAVADHLTEDDYSTTDWEGSKTQMNQGKIATMVLGSWAVQQIQAAGDKSDDIGYMPFPISVKGKQYAAPGGGYAYGINKNSSSSNQEAAMIFVKWLTEKSKFAYNEGGLPVAKADTTLPALFDKFKNVTFLEGKPVSKDESDLFNDLNTDSELAINSGGNARVQAIVEDAATKSKTFDSIMNEWNDKWNAALQTENVDIKYTTVAK
ncbi:ABC transporter substrate-binding protein [Bifidobacterium sp.]|jgi:ABC-type glycerol-3-phosphate transport system substrate-binding protein|uniref:ABC transporter substrate-binding protein n=1 Tax=Bifidobacterium sp. TaxID=41200 RepID=UPI0025C6DBD5|nr:ABC transporter substrate-binding protein [Bifidobacterium sp.]MCI1634624.1 ABC transporter substrate-binding protein [Bifidobacterium sp.]